MILCITPNPDIERTWIMDTVCMGDVNHVHQVTVTPSGKGVNVARAVHTLGGESFCAGFWGGLTGRYLESLVSDMGIPAKWTWIKGETRTAIAIIETSNPERDATLISESGPRVTNEDWERMHADVSAIQTGVACICGRLPGNSSVDPLIRIIQSLEKRGTEVWVDTGSESLQAALTAKPTGIKVNSREASEVTGLDVSDISSALEAADYIRKLGIKKVILTMGKNGAILSCEEGEWSSRPPLIKRISSVGSGDSFLAGFLHGQTVGNSYPEMLRMATAAGAANALEPGGGCFMLQDYYDLLDPVHIQRI